MGLRLSKHPHRRTDGEPGASYLELVGLLQSLSAHAHRKAPMLTRTVNLRCGLIARRLSQRRAARVQARTAGGQSQGAQYDQVAIRASESHCRRKSFAHEQVYRLTKQELNSCCARQPIPPVGMVEGPAVIDGKPDVHCESAWLH